MKKYLLHSLLFLLLCISAALQAQEHFGKTMPEVKKSLDQLAAVSSSKSSVKTTDSTVVLAVTEKTGLVRFTYGFDKQTGACNYQKTQASCDSCYKKYLEKLLAQKSYDWKKINENQYVSNFESKLLIELPVDEKDHYFILFRAQWTKEFYEIMVKN